MAVVIGACGSEDQAGETTTAATPEATATAASSAVAMLDEANNCTAAPKNTQGPYCFDADRVRSDIREDREGVVMRPALRVQQRAECTPVKDVVVLLWHCDALGTYSGFEPESQGGGAPGAPTGQDNEGQGGRPPPPQSGSGGGDQEATPTGDEFYLRGEQVTNSDGVVEFVTFYPGWYTSRAVHAHLKVFLDNKTAARGYGRPRRRHASLRSPRRRSRVD